MNKKISLGFLVLVVLIILTSLVMARTIEVGKGGILEKAEPTLEVLNLFLSIITIILAISIVHLLRGELRKNWIYLTFAVGFFTLLEAYGALKNYKIFNWFGLDDLIELFFIILLLLTVYNLRKLFKQLSTKR